ncbi:LolA family protein [Natrarchaeobaculum sulfurireducens]|nr:DUF2092 domain-containing protein [Natrarchaeobaculum sulfurireducens]
MNRHRVSAGVVLVAFLMLVAGCQAPAVPSTDGPDDPDPEAVFEAAFVHAEDLEAVSGERTTVVTAGDETQAERVAVTERPYAEYRSEVLESERADREGALYVSNAAGSWWYDPTANTVSVYEANESYESEAVRMARADVAADRLEYYDLEYRGTETVADREAHVLDVTAKDEAVTDGVSVLVGDTEFVYALETVDPADELEVTEQTVWIDAEYDYPLKERVVSEDVDGEPYEFTERFETVIFNDVDEGTSAFDPPENATADDLE